MLFDLTVVNQWHGILLSDVVVFLFIFLYNYILMTEIDPKHHSFKYFCLLTCQSNTDQKNHSSSTAMSTIYLNNPQSSLRGS
jgi:hypothetical protein